MDSTLLVLLGIGLGLPLAIFLFLWLYRRRALRPPSHKATTGVSSTQLAKAPPSAEQTAPAKPLTPSEPALLAPPLPPPSPVSFAFREFQPLAPFNRNQPHWDEQDPVWQSAMQQIGQRLCKHHASHVFLSHGTFVGRDPFDIIELLRSSFPSSVKLLNHRFMQQLKNRKEALLKDLGNFTPEYCKLLATACGPSIEIVRFTWSSGNHHLARVMGALELLSVIAPFAQSSPHQRFLLIGHSHAGQLFAILTQLLADRAKAERLIAISARAGLVLPDAADMLAVVGRQPLDFVSLGTPPRYEWQLQAHHRLLHIINHRGPTPAGGSISGLLTTRDGDYIQQWGIAGSDSLCPIRLHAELNRQLVAYLGIGFNMSHWKHAMKKRQRLPACGHTLLTDYHDNGKSFNCLATIFGHGVYTRYEALLYNMTEITDFFYNKPPLFTSEGAS